MHTGIGRLAAIMDSAATRIGILIDKRNFYIRLGKMTSDRDACYSGSDYAYMFCHFSLYN
jgi:hypothetical protein